MGSLTALPDDPSTDSLEVSSSVLIYRNHDITARGWFFERNDYNNNADLPVDI